jgi:hypothetical protein
VCLVTAISIWFGRSLTTWALFRAQGIRVEIDHRPPFRIDHSMPFVIELGRGGGWRGLDTVKLDENGNVVLHRWSSERKAEAVYRHWETATLRLTDETVKKMLQAIEANSLMSLHAAYHANVHDGTQWVFWANQGSNEKSVYCNNYFPNEMTQFAGRLDQILSDAGLDFVQWTAVPDGEGRRHERDLWKSMR